MVYFAYDWRTEWRELHRRGRAISPYFRGPRTERPAVLRNFRLCFPVFSLGWAGGAANVAPEPGKFVAGTAYEFSPGTMKILDELANRTAAELGVARVLRREVLVETSPRPTSGGGHVAVRTITTVRAVTHELVIAERTHVPPSEQLVGGMIRAACRLGHSELWVAQLRSLVPAAEFGAGRLTR